MVIKVRKFFETRYGALIFSLISGLAYFGLAIEFIIGNTGGKGMLLGFFFFPAIVCGMALVLLKSIKMWQEQEAFGKITAMAVFHIILIIISLVSVLARVIL